MTKQTAPSGEQMFLGMKIKIAKPLTLLLAPLFGKLLHRGGGMVFYQYKGDIVVVEDEQP